MSDTPRTDAAIKEANGIAALLAPFARTLERELNNQYEENVARINAQALAENERDQLKAELADRTTRLHEVAKELEDANHELALFRANNRYQKGYGDGYAFALSDARKKLTELPPRG